MVHPISDLPDYVSVPFSDCVPLNQGLQGAVVSAVEILRMPSFLSGFALNQQKTSLVYHLLLTDPEKLSHIVPLLALSFEKPNAS